MPPGPPADAASQLLYHLASKTQVMDVVTGLLMRGPPGLVVPNMAVGCTARFLTRVSRMPLTANSWAHLRRARATIQAYGKMPAKALAGQLAAAEGVRGAGGEHTEGAQIMVEKKDTSQKKKRKRKKGKSCQEYGLINQMKTMGTLRWLRRNLKPGK